MAELMPTLYDRLSKTDQDRRNKLIDDLGQYAWLMHNDKNDLFRTDRDAWRKRNRIIEEELRGICKELLPLTTQQERIDMRGELSRSDLANFCNGSLPDFTGITDEERAAVRKDAFAKRYTFTNVGERMRSERFEKLAALVNDAQQELLDSEVEKVIAFLRTKKVGTPYLYRQLRDGKHRA